LGRRATQIAQLLIGKNKPYFAPHLDCGDFVVVTNDSEGQLLSSPLKFALQLSHCAIV